MSSQEASRQAPRQASRQARAALTLARRLGLPAERALVLHAGSNAVVHLHPTPVVARVARLTALARPQPRDALAREVDLARWLAQRGAPVLPPTSLVDPGPHEVEGEVASLWPFVDVTGHLTSDPRACAAALAALHEAMAGYPGALPGLIEVVEDASRAAARGAGWLPARARAALDAPRAGAAALAADVDASAPTPLGRRPLHGDAHPRNLLRTGSGVLWCDLEDAVTAPLEWDLAVLARSPHHDGAAALAAYRAVTGFTPDAALLARLHRLRDWQATCWQVLFADDEPGRREAALAAVSRLGAWSPGA